MADKLTPAMLITQKYLRRYGQTKRAKWWADKTVHIETENGVWRTDGYGYTFAGSADAWALPFPEAVKMIDHCGPEKRGKFLLVPPDSESHRITTKGREALE